MNLLFTIKISIKRVQYLYHMLIRKNFKTFTYTVESLHFKLTVHGSKKSVQDGESSKERKTIPHK